MKEIKLVTITEVKNIDEKGEIPRDYSIYNLIDNCNYFSIRLFSIFQKKI